MIFKFNLLIKKIFFALYFPAILFPFLAVFKTNLPHFALQGDVQSSLNKRAH